MARGSEESFVDFPVKIEILAPFSLGGEDALDGNSI